MTEHPDACPNGGMHDFRFAYIFAKPPVAGQPNPQAVYYCTKCLHEEVRPALGLMVPVVQVQLVQGGPPPVGPHPLLGN